MNQRERWLATVHFQPVDHVPDGESGCWVDTLKAWHAQGLPEYVNSDERADIFFGFEIREFAPLADFICWHSFYGHRPDDPYYQTYPSLVRQIKELARSHGSRGGYLVDEWSSEGQSCIWLLRWARARCGRTHQFTHSCQPSAQSLI